MLLAYGRVAAMLKEHFVPYLQHVMPDVLRSANLQLDVAVVDGTLRMFAKRRAVPHTSFSQS